MALGWPLSAEESVKGLPRCLKLKFISFTPHISSPSSSLGFQVHLTILTILFTSLTNFSSRFLDVLE